jgi:hypothetical protein
LSNQGSIPAIIFVTESVKKNFKMKLLLITLSVFLFARAEALIWEEGSFSNIPENAIFVGLDTSNHRQEIFVGR